MKLTGAAFLVSRGMKVLQPARQLIQNVLYGREMTPTRSEDDTFGGGWYLFTSGLVDWMRGRVRRRPMPQAKAWLAELAQVRAELARWYGPVRWRTHAQSPHASLAQSAATLGVRGTANTPVVKHMRELVQRLERRCEGGRITAMLITAASFEHAIHSLGAGAEPSELCRGINFAGHAAGAYLDAQRRQLSSPEELLVVLRTAACGDLAMADAVFAATRDAGPCGALEVQIAETDDSGIEIRILDGYQLPRPPTGGPAHGVLWDPEFVVSLNPPNEAQLSIYGVDGGQRLLLCPSINSSVALDDGSIVLELGEDRAALDTLEDVAALTGASTDGTVAGSAERLHFEGEAMRICGGHGTDTLEARCGEIKDAIERSTGAEREQYQRRLAYLAGCLVFIEVGGGPGAEFRCEMAIRTMHACRTAMESGELKGGANALREAGRAVRRYRAEWGVRAGIRALAAGLSAPYRCLARMTGFTAASDPAEVQLAVVEEAAAGTIAMLRDFGADS